jgi:hypothetical protein
VNGAHSRGSQSWAAESGVLTWDRLERSWRNFVSSVRALWTGIVADDSDKTQGERGRFDGRIQSADRDGDGAVLRPATVTVRSR